MMTMEAVPSDPATDPATPAPDMAPVHPTDTALEIRRLELEYGDKHDQRRSDLVKWFVAAIWPAILSLLTAWSQHLAIDTAKTEINKNVAVIDDKATAAASSADNAAKKATAAASSAVAADKTAADASATSAKLLAAVTGDPDDATAAAEARARSDIKSEIPPAPPKFEPRPAPATHPATDIEPTARSLNYEVIGIHKLRHLGAK